MPNSSSSWKDLRLSFERPYKDDQGDIIPVLLDLTPQGQQIYEPKETSSAKLDINLQRIFVERGADFFDRKEDLRSGGSRSEIRQPATIDDAPDALTEAGTSKSMTVEELHSMRMELLPQLFVALGEMSHARELLTSILSASQVESSADVPAPLLSTTLVTKPNPIVSVHAFNTQLIIGSKDEALRKAAELFKTAAERMERGRLKGEKYWVNALNIRWANWGLIPAPLPPGSATGKGADKTSKDFFISYGLEGSPALFRRHAVARLASDSDFSNDLVFASHQNSRLKISISAETEAPANFFTSPVPDGPLTLDSALKVVQTEAVDQEIFALLVREAGILPTASARVSERLIVIDAAQGVYLTFELVDIVHPSRFGSPSGENDENICELIYHVLHVLLLRRQSRTRSQKSNDNQSTEIASSMLQQIIDMLQYRVFCARLDVNLRKAISALHAVGIPTTFTFTSVGETGQDLISVFCDRRNKTIGGETVIRIDNWHTLRLTFTSPSSLVAHLSQATLPISSIPQLSQLLMDEIEKCLLERICELGRELCRAIGGVWFIDSNRCIARWEGCVLTFRIFYEKGFTIGCSAFRLDGVINRQGHEQTYCSGQTPLLHWVERIITDAATADNKHI